jgi:hypothetical protein
MVLTDQVAVNQNVIIVDEEDCFVRVILNEQCTTTFDSVENLQTVTYVDFKLPLHFTAGFYCRFVQSVVRTAVRMFTLCNRIL